MALQTIFFKTFSAIESRRIVTNAREMEQGVAGKGAQIYEWSLRLKCKITTIGYSITLYGWNLFQTSFFKPRYEADRQKRKEQSIWESWAQLEK